MSIHRQKNNPLCEIEIDIHSGTGACSFYNLSRGARLVGRMCFSLTGKWYTVISELQPRVFISSLFQTKIQLKENKMREHDLHFLYSYFLIIFFVLLVFKGLSYFNSYLSEVGQLICHRHLAIFSLCKTIKM